MMKKIKNYKIFLQWLLSYVFFIGLITFFIQSTNVPWGDGFSWKGLGVFLYTIFRLSTHQILLAFLISLPFFILGVFYFLIFKQRKTFFLILVTSVVAIQTLFLIFSVVNTYVFRLYKMHLDETTLPMVFSLGLDSIFEFMRNSGDVGWACFILFVLTLISLSLAWWTIKFKLRMKFAFFYLIVYGTCQIVHGFADAYGYNSILSKNRYLQYPKLKLTFVGRLGKLGLMGIREKRTLNLVSKPVSSSISLNYPKKPLQYEPRSFRLPNIFIIVLDSIRFDLLNKEVMPNLWAFKNKNIEFFHHYSTGNSSVKGLFGMLYGISPVYFNLIRNNSVRPVLINKLLSEQYHINLYTYHTLASAQLDVTAFVGLKKDTNRFLTFTSTLFPIWKRDQELTNFFLKSLQERPKKEPQFNLLFLGSAHDFSSPSPEESKFQPIVPFLRRLKLSSHTPVEPVLNLYKSSLFFLDQLVGKMIKALEVNGWMEESLVIITSDHGQEVNKLKLGNWGHLSNFSDWQIRVPMVVRWPGKKAQKFKHITSHLDVVPTLFQEVFKSTNRIQDYSSGRNLFYFNSKEKKRYLFVSGWDERAIINGKEVYSLESTGVKVFDSLTYEEKKEKSKNIPFLLQFINQSKNQFL